MLRRTNYGLWVDDKGYNSETENAIEYIVACAKENGIEVIEGQTALSIPFIAKIMKAMNENKRPKGEWIVTELFYEGESNGAIIKCNKCGNEMRISPRRFENLYLYEKFCPHCGADMKGVK